MDLYFRILLGALASFFPATRQVLTLSVIQTGEWMPALPQSPTVFPPGKVISQMQWRRKAGGTMGKWVMGGGISPSIYRTHVVRIFVPAFGQPWSALVIYLSPGTQQVTMQNQLMPAKHSNCVAYRKAFSQARLTHFPGLHLMRILVCTLKSNPRLKPKRNMHALA